MDQVRLAVIGGGAIAQRRHLPESMNREDRLLVAIVDPVPERAQLLGNQYRVVTYSDCQEVLIRTDIDAVIVCTPNHLHADVSIAAAQAGKHILCEKPIATTIEEAKAMIRAAQEADVLLMIGHNQRFLPCHIRAKQLIQTGAIGRVLSFRSTFAHGGPESWSVDGNGSWFFQKQLAFCGAIGDLGIHKIELIQWLLGESVIQINAMIGTLERPFTNVEDHGILLLRMTSGALGTVTASWTHHPGEDNSTEIHGDAGSLYIGTHPDYGLILRTKDGAQTFYQEGNMPTNDVHQQPRSGVLDAFVNSIIHKQKPPITGEDGLSALRVALTALEASRLGQTLEVG